MPSSHGGSRKSKLLTQFWTYSKFVSVLCVAWCLGYYELSVAWVGVVSNELSVAWVGVVSIFIYIWMFENYQFNLSFRNPQQFVQVRYV